MHLRKRDASVWVHQGVRLHSGQLASASLWIAISRNTIWSYYIERTTYKCNYNRQHSYYITALLTQSWTHQARQPAEKQCKNPAYLSLFKYTRTSQAICRPYSLNRNNLGYELKFLAILPIFECSHSKNLMKLPQLVPLDFSLQLPLSPRQWP